jgi:hypothetical protein
MVRKGRVLLVGLCLAGLAAVAIPPAAAQSGETPKATEVGVTPTEIHIAEIADVDNPFGPVRGGRSTGERRGKVHQQQAGGGGIAGRKLAVNFTDSTSMPTTAATA